MALRHGEKSRARFAARGPSERGLKRSRDVDRDRLKGKSKIVVGGIKAKVGEIAGNDELKEEGEAERQEGKVQEAVGKVKDAARDVKDAVKDAVKD
jgi:uncharacterized protein YjbJ (UPF0337 family)